MTNLKTSLATAAAALTIVLTASACGGGSHAKVASLGNNGSSSSQSNATAQKQSFRDALLDYSKCMREHGIDMPDPTFTDNRSGGGGAAIAVGPGQGMDPKSETFKQAQTACQPIMDDAQKDFTPPSPEEQAKMRDRALKFAQCMRDHGIDMPDPTFDDNGGMTINVEGGSGPSGPSSDGNVTGAGPDQKFLDASKACEAEGGGGPIIGGAGPATAAQGSK